MKALLATVAVVLAFSPVSTPAAPAKPPVLKVDPKVKVELARVVKAYQALGDFSLNSSETANEAGNVSKRQFTGRFATNGRRAIKETGSAVPLARLFDGKQLIELEGGGPIKRRALTKLAGGPEAAQFFFRPSSGLAIIARMLEKKTATFGSADDITSSYVLRKLAGGKTQVENRAKKRSGKDVIDVIVRMNIGAPGYIEGINIAASIKGKPLLYMSTAFSRPTKLTGKDDFNWDSLAPIETSPADQPRTE